MSLYMHKIENRIKVKNDFFHADFTKQTRFNIVSSSVH